MYYKRFQDIDISALGMGAMRLPVKGVNYGQIDAAETQKLIDAAIEGGVNYFDTAYMYHEGESERFLGEALAKHPRESYYLATKFYAAANPDIRLVFEEQLQRCGVEYFDFYLLHDINEHSIAAYTDEKRDYLGFLLEQKAKGRIRRLGFSSHAAPDTLSRFLNWHDGFDMALLQLNYLDWTLLEGKRQYEIVSEHNIPIWVMEPLKGGILSTLNRKATEILESATPGRSVSSWGFRFLMGLSNVQTILSGMSTIEQVDDNLRTFERHDPLDEWEQAALQRAVSAFVGELGIPCSACCYCCPVCPARIDIPQIIRKYNEEQISGESWRVEVMSRAGRGPETCLQCGVCLEHCPQKINIPDVLLKIARSNP